MTPWAYSFGQCTWWVRYKRRDENLTWMGDAWNWANSARARGLTVTTAAINATVVFAPYVQGAGGLGHVAHVEQVLSDGWVLVSEMNFAWNGGGEGRVSYRFIHVGEGVWFIH
jgi:surface antigen